MDKKTQTEIAKAKPKEIAPKVYAMLIKTKFGNFLWMEAAYSLETAFGQAKMQLSRLHPDIDFGVSKIELFNHETIESLFSRSSDLNLSGSATVIPQRKPRQTQQEKVSALMKQIIENKDWKLLEENRSIFTKPQIQFLEDKLKNN